MIHERTLVLRWLPRIYAFAFYFRRFALLLALFQNSLAAELDVDLLGDVLTCLQIQFSIET